MQPPTPQTHTTQAAFETLRYEVAEGLATVTLNRPEQLNTFTALMRL